METTVRHVWPLDHALARGMTCEFEGKQWTFTPITYDDWGDVIRLARSEALAAYLDAIKGKSVGYAQRIQDLNGIVYGAMAQHAMSALRSPTIRRMIVRKSLLKHHPDLSDDDLDQFLEQEHRANLVGDLVTLLSFGPIDPAAVEKTLDGEANPTMPGSGPPPGISRTCAPSSCDTDTPSKRSDA